MRNTKKKPEPHPIDILAGERVREIRLLKGMTQGELAEKIGVTFQQIQKYESAVNRISASRLYLICDVLETTIPEFFTGLYSRRRKTSRVMKMLESAEAVKLAGLFLKMSHGKRQRFYEVDVQHQQIQKYEEAINRVSVSKLYLICEALEMSLPEFFENLYEKQKKKGIMKMIDSDEGTKLAGLFFRMSPCNSKHFIDLGKEFAEG